jgi:hypothetical protein
VTAEDQGLRSAGVNTSTEAVTPSLPRDGIGAKTDCADAAHRDLQVKMERPSNR